MALTGHGVNYLCYADDSEAVLYIKKKSPDLSVEAFKLALPIFPGWPSIVLPYKTCQWHVLGIKKPRLISRGFVLALPIFPGRHQPSIVGAYELNFCVRDGNRWTLIAINTNFSGCTLKTEHQIYFRF